MLLKMGEAASVGIGGVWKLCTLYSRNKVVFFFFRGSFTFYLKNKN